jgi:hypothetical protein
MRLQPADPLSAIEAAGFEIEEQEQGRIRRAIPVMRPMNRGALALRSEACVLG